MVKLRQVFYNAVLLSSALVAAGCGEPAAPPPGAPQETSAPTVDLGSDAGNKDSAAGKPDSSPPAGSPSQEKGEPK
jgi:hypothetical protein